MVTMEIYKQSTFVPIVQHYRSYSNTLGYSILNWEAISLLAAAPFLIREQWA